METLREHLPCIWRGTSLIPASAQAGQIGLGDCASEAKASVQGPQLKAAEPDTRQAVWSTSPMLSDAA